ncbi:hypothetical protein K469DRAFT_720820 [Zopfia rhizophila CBS 207.26]|uniref:Uncharacterized protein n=1 Tax=Zopfia rhizophila CBS 207.26 TaxID=1314779 RepID=A0A6A6DFU7_9PEZI|nr:hypothetical protein K469DRAFT_720820 [Zopfia rhizophila CBS 207.26]
MIPDNADDVETFSQLQQREHNGRSNSSSVSLAAYLRQSRNGSILITSRNNDAAARLAGS